MAWIDFLSPRRRLQNKILFPFLLVTVIITIFAVGWVGRIITQDFDTRTEDLLNNHRKFVTNKIKEIEERNVFYAHFMADVTQLASYFPQTYMTRSILIYLMEFLEKSHIKTDIVGENFTDESRRQLIQKGFYGFRVTDLIEQKEKDQIYLSVDAVSLIGERPEKTKEVVVLSYPLDTSFMEEVKSKIDSDITLIYKGRPILSTLTDRRVLALIGQNLEHDLFSRLVNMNELFIADFGYKKTRQRAIYFPFSVGSENVAAFAVSMSLDQLYAMREQLIRNILLGGGGVLVFVLALYSFFSRKITRPIKELSLATKKIAEGNLDLEIKKRSQDEVGELEDSFNQMSKKLKAYYEEIQQDKEKLEIKVKERTMDLARINKELQAEIVERKRAEENLKRSSIELRNLSTHLQSVREDERAYVAREIHDELGQLLTVLKINLSNLTKKFPPDRKPLFEKAKAISGLIDTCIQTIQRISENLRPSLLDDLGIIPAIEWHAKEFQNLTGIKCGVDFHNIDVDNFVLDKDRSTAIFRIFQETLTNVARHANATEAKAFLKNENNSLILQISDNGKGIIQEQITSPTSFGIIGIKERAHSIGGKIEIDGVKDKGTTVTLTIEHS